jgi:hypothetical protein
MTQSTERHEYQESIILHQPGAMPNDSIEATAVTLANENVTFAGRTVVPPVMSKAG